MKSLDQQQLGCGIQMLRDSLNIIYPHNKLNMRTPNIAEFGLRYLSPENVKARLEKGMHAGFVLLVFLSL